MSPTTTRGGWPACWRGSCAGTPCHTVRRYPNVYTSSPLPGPGDHAAAFLAPSWPSSAATAPVPPGRYGGWACSVPADGIGYAAGADHRREHDRPREAVLTLRSTTPACCSWAGDPGVVVPRPAFLTCVRRANDRRVPLGDVTNEGCSPDPRASPGAARGHGRAGLLTRAGRTTGRSDKIRARAAKPQVAHAREADPSDDRQTVRPRPSHYPRFTPIVTA